VLIRFCAFDALHDVGIKGFTLENKRLLIKKLEQYAHVFVSTETPLPDDLQKYILQIPKNKIHDAIYYAKLLVNDTGTMTTEAAILGTPAVRFSSFVGENDMSNFIELEKDFGLIYNYNNFDEAMIRALELVQEPNLKEQWEIKRNRLLACKIDMATFMAWYIANYPSSFEAFVKNPEIQFELK
jgi:predicted glycosyltransferase